MQIVAIAIAAALAFAGAVEAQSYKVATASITMFPIPTPDSLTYGITGGPDGNIWFLEEDGHRIGRITPSGAIAEFPASSTGSAKITSGPDGNLWFAPGDLARVSTSGVVSFFGVGDDFSFLSDIASGPDGNLWITNNQGSAFGFLGGVNVIGTIERVATTGAQIARYPLSRVNISLGEITKGVNGDLWFTEFDSHIGRISTTGAITEFPIPQLNTHFNHPYANTLAISSDGNVWFTAQGGLFRMTPQGVFTQLIPAESLVGDVIVGPDQRIWFTTISSIGFVSSDGLITEVVLPAIPSRIAAGPDGNIWFTSVPSNAIGRLDVASIAPVPPRRRSVR